MKTLHVLANRPNIPEGWKIINAPRPMWGTREWTGEFILGKWYAAIDPNDPLLLDMLTANERDDGTELFYHDADELAAIGWEWVERNYPDNDLNPEESKDWLTQRGLDILNGKVE